MKGRKAKSDTFFLSLEKSDSLRKLVNMWRKRNRVTLKTIAAECDVNYDAARQILRPKSKIRIRRTFCDNINAFVQETIQDKKNNHDQRDKNN